MATMTWQQAVEIMAGPRFEDEDDQYGDAIRCIMNAIEEASEYESNAESLEMWVVGGSWEGTETLEDVVNEWDRSE